MQRVLLYHCGYSELENAYMSGCFSACWSGMHCRKKISYCCTRIWSNTKCSNTKTKLRRGQDEPRKKGGYILYDLDVHFGYPISALLRLSSTSTKVFNS